MRHRLTPFIVTVTVLVALIVGTIVTGLTVAVVRLRSSADDTARAERTIGRISRVERLVIDLETGQRGFLVTRDARFLQPYEAARAALPDLLDELVAAEDGPDQGKQVRELAATVRSYEAQWATPIVALARRDVAAARRRVATGVGKAMVDRLRVQFERYAANEQAEADVIREDADADGRRAVGLGVAGAVLSMLLVAAFGSFLLRSVVLPVRRLAVAVGHVGRGDVQAEVSETGAVGEVGVLTRGFNDMSRALQEHHDELEGQTAEVEAQRDDLERTFSELEDEKAWVETLFGFVERLVAEHELQGIAEAALKQVVRQARCDAGIVRVVGEDGELELCAAVGIARSRVPASVGTGEGVSGRALAEHRPIVLSHAEAGLEIEGLGGPEHAVRVRHELHVPLHRGPERIGVLVVARVADRPFGSEETDRVRGLCDQASVAIAKALEERRAAQLAAVNAAVLDATSFGLVMYDRKKRVTIVNRVMREMCEVLGVTYEVGGTTDAAGQLSQHLVDPESIAKDLEMLDKDPTYSVRAELHVEEHDRWFIARTDPVFDADGQIIGRIVSFRETSHEHEIQRMRDEFVATVTHELRTPLSSVVAAVDLLEDETEEPTPGQAHWTGMIRRNVERLLRLVDDLLTVARAESGEFTLHAEPLDLATVAHDAAASARAGAEAKDVTIEVQTEASPLRGDATRLAQACDNLLANAVKFTPEGGLVRVRVRTEARRRGDDAQPTAVLVVADSGIGIPPEDRERLFERFYRAPAATRGAIPGTGLGLTITKAIVEAHGGTIRVEDGIDGGTAFVVALPVAGPPERD